jgi:mannose-6-phosphate isomerase
VNPAPLRIEPIFSPRIWGARSLAPLYPEKCDLAEPLGEAWLTGLDCRIDSGPFRGKTLGEAWREMPAEWRGTELAIAGDFPLLVKFIFPNDKLSIQVHPDDAYAAAHERAVGGRGKTEMWHIVAAEPKAQVLLGLKPGVDKQAFLDGLEKHALECLFQSHPVHPGDTLFVPAGAPHTIGPGMIICEVQQYSDLTYRVYDYGRLDAQGKPRDLHVDKALEVISFGLTSAGKTSKLPLPTEGFEKSLLAACPYFATERWEPTERLATQTTNPSHFDLLVVLSGDGTLNTRGCSLPSHPGDCWFLPANLGDYHFAPMERAATLIRTYVPHLAALREELRLAGNAETATRSTVFD